MFPFAILPPVLQEKEYIVNMAATQGGTALLTNLGNLYTCGGVIAASGVWSLARTDVALMSADTDRLYIITKDNTPLSGWTVWTGPNENWGFTTLVKPTDVPVQFFASKESTAAETYMLLLADGRLIYRGGNKSGEAGIGNTTEQTRYIVSNTNVKRFWHSNNISVVEKFDGTFWGAGGNSFNAIGAGQRQTWTLLANWVSDLGPPIGIRLNVNWVALQYPGMVFRTTGRNLLQLPVGAPDPGATPVDIPSGTFFPATGNFIIDTMFCMQNYNSGNPTFGDTNFIIDPVNGLMSQGSNIAGMTGLNVRTGNTRPYTSCVGVPTTDLVGAVFSTGGAWTLAWGKRKIIYCGDATYRGNSSLLPLPGFTTGMVFKDTTTPLN